MEKSKFFERIGWVGMVTSILMYVFYFRVIQQNLSGHPGDPLQPLMAGINCTLWCVTVFSRRSVTGLSPLPTPPVLSSASLQPIRRCKAKEKTSALYDSKYRHITLIFVYNTISKAYHAIKL